MTTPTRFSPTRLVLAMTDLIGYSRLFSQHGEAEIALFLDAYYVLCHERVDAAGGRVIKFIGDSCLASFPVDCCAGAVAAMRKLRVDARELSQRHGMPIDSGTNMHLATVLRGAFGPEGRQQDDVLGSGVNQVFLMGRGAGFRISEPVYRQLPSDQRSIWNKHKPAVTYTEV